jgi:hypothetical protein
MICFAVVKVKLIAILQFSVVNGARSKVGSVGLLG